MIRMNNLLSEWLDTLQVPYSSVMQRLALLHLYVQYVLKYIHGKNVQPKALIPNAVLILLWPPNIK